MNVYLVRYTRKNAGSTPDDGHTSGGSYDIHGEWSITASAPGKAREAALRLCRQVYPHNHVVVRVPVLVMEDV